MLQGQAQVHTQELLQLPATSCQGLTYQLTVDGMVRTASSSWCTLLGYTPQAVRQQPLHTFLMPTNAEAVAVMLEMLLTAAQDSHCAEWQWRHRDGTTRWFAVTHCAVYDDHGQLFQIIGSAHDITAYKQQIAALQEQVLFYDSLLNALPDPVFVKDEAHRVILVNAAHCRMADLSATEILAPDQADPTPADELAVFRAQDLLVLTSDQPIENEETLTDSQGIRHIISTRKVAHSLPNGQKVLLGTVRDITDRRQVEARLQHEQALMRRLLDAIPDLIFYKDLGNVYAGCNRAFEALAGVAEEELIGKTAAEIFPNAAKERYDQQDYAVLHDKVTLRVEQWVTYPDGRIALLDTLLTPFLTPTGESLGLLGICRDITERNAMEGALRTAKEAAESTTRAKSTFLSTITHELRTPMNGVLGLSGLLLDTELNAEQLDLVHSIRASGNTLLTLINDILDFSKVEANKLELEISSFELRPCIESALDLVAAQATVKDLTLVYLIDPALPPCIEQDETRLRQILTNLLSNAVKFSDIGEIVVTVTGHMLADRRWELHFAVRDRGIGISPDRLDRLFLPFSQVDVSTTRHYGGTGLGLAISKRLADLMGGTMWVESEAGSGSTFHFTMQVCQNEDGGTPWEINRAILSGRQILIVEESVAIRRLLTQQLTAWGIDVTVRTALDEEELAQQTTAVDALILDANSLVRAIHPRTTHPRTTHPRTMEWSGIKHQLTRLRQIVPQLPIILLTQLGERLPSANSQSQLATVTKPIHASQLHDALVTVISGRSLPTRRSGRAYVVDTKLAERHPLRILLAEDNIVNQKVVVGILANHGYRIDVAVNGLEVLDALNRQRYELILMDINMPDMDGFTTTDIIRSSWAPAMQPHIIALTANALHGDNQRCLDAGMNDYLRKPLEVPELIAALQRVPVRKDQPLIPSSSMEIKPAQSQPVPYTSAQPQDDAVDISVLWDITELLGADGHTTVCELITLFLESSLPLLQQLRTAVAEDDITAICRVAHTLRSPAGQLGAHRFAHLCEELETIYLNDRPGDGEALMHQISAEYERVRHALHTSSAKFCREADAVL